MYTAEDIRNKRIAFINFTKEQYGSIFEHFNQLYPNTYRYMYQEYVKS